MILGILALVASGQERGSDHVSMPETLKSLYIESSIAGLHSHPTGFEGGKLDKAEARYHQRRLAVAEKLSRCFGSQLIDEIDMANAVEIDSVYWIKGPSLSQEWSNLFRAQRALKKIERWLKSNHDICQPIDRGI